MGIMVIIPFMNIKSFENTKIVLPDLPFDKQSLIPYMSEETLNYHHNKHHQAYVNKALSLLNITNGEDANLIKHITITPNTHNNPLFFNLCQIFTHNVFWLCLENKPVTESEKNTLSRHFGSYDKFCEEFINCGLNHFGSGWVWLLANEHKWWITTSSNGDIPEEVMQGAHIITMCDVWEHAYYIDYRNKRQEFLQNFTHHLMKLYFPEI